MPVLRKEFVEIIDQAMKRLNYNPYDVNRVSGDRISHATVWNILNYQVNSVKDETVEILAEVLNIPRKQLFAIARGEKEEANDASERFKSMALIYEQLRTSEKNEIEPVLSMVERELDRLSRKVVESKREAKERTRERGQNMEAPNTTKEIQKRDLDRVTKEVQAQGFKVDHKTVVAVITGKEVDCDKETREAILNAANIENGDNVFSKVINGK